MSYTLFMHFYLTTTTKAFRKFSLGVRVKRRILGLYGQEVFVFNSVIFQNFISVWHFTRHQMNAFQNIE